MPLQVFPKLHRFWFWHVPLPTLLADTANQDVSHGKLPGISDINKKCFPFLHSSIHRKFIKDLGMLPPLYKMNQRSFRGKGSDPLCPSPALQPVCMCPCKHASVTTGSCQNFEMMPFLHFHFPSRVAAIRFNTAEFQRLLSKSHFLFGTQCLPLPNGGLTRRMTFRLPLQEMWEVTASFLLFLRSDAAPSHFLSCSFSSVAHIVIPPNRDMILPICRIKSQLFPLLQCTDISVCWHL